MANFIFGGALALCFAALGSMLCWIFRPRPEPGPQQPAQPTGEMPAFVDEDMAAAVREAEAIVAACQHKKGEEA